MDSDTDSLFDSFEDEDLDTFGLISHNLRQVLELGPAPQRRKEGSPSYAPHV